MPCEEKNVEEIIAPIETVDPISRRPGCNKGGQPRQRGQWRTAHTPVLATFDRNRQHKKTTSCLPARLMNCRLKDCLVFALVALLRERTAEMSVERTFCANWHLKPTLSCGCTPTTLTHICAGQVDTRHGNCWLSFSSASCLESTIADGNNWGMMNSMTAGMAARVVVCILVKIPPFPNQNSVTVPCVISFATVDD